MNSIPMSLIFIQVAALFAGLTLFLSGMSAMSHGLQEAAGRGLRMILQRATTRRLRAVSLGTLLGGLIHSSAASVMLIGFINAGLVSFRSSVPVLLGINIGTTLSMLLISFRLGDACWLAILVGFGLRAWSRLRSAGTAIFGFGLIFLGLNVMSQAIYPFRDVLAPVLSYSDGSTVVGMLTGVLVSAGFTSIIQSSGATIGMVFAMLTAGAMTSFMQAYPVIIGASIGTCATALIGAARSGVDAKRCALTHLLFNLFSTSFAMLTAPLMYRLIPFSTPGALSGAVSPHMLVSQAANANVIRMVVSALIVFPFTGGVALVVERLLPSRRKSGTELLLDPELAHTPEDALRAALEQLQRMAELCSRRLAIMPGLLEHRGAGRRRLMQETEVAVATIQESMQHFLRQVALVPLTRRQSLLATLLYDGIDHLERIAEHIGVLAQILHERHHRAGVVLPDDVQKRLLALNRCVEDVLGSLEGVLVPLGDDRREAIRDTLAYRDAFKVEQDAEREQIASDLSAGECTPVVAIFRTRYHTELSRIVKHAQALALEAQNPRFRLKPQRFGKRVGDRSV